MVDNFLSVEPVFQTHLAELHLLARGKVRDIYAVDEQHLLLVASDRLSAFDVVMPDAVPGKGIILTQLALFWFQHLAGRVPDHRTDLDLHSLPLSEVEHSQLQGRSMLVKRLRPLPVEAVVRGYLVGSGWKEYQQSQQLCGIPLPKGLQQAQKLKEPLFTPASKAEVGDHDINISIQQMQDRVGVELTQKIQRVSLELYDLAAAYARERGIIIADTKFEFGLDDQGTLVLMDEIFTPDSSRFWPVKHYQTGISPISFDKQFVRDYLESLDWDKTSPGPKIPVDVLRRTSEKYREVFQLLTQ